jgi:YafQ family addiction module toxin component
MYTYDLRTSLEKNFQKLAKKNKKQLQIISNKIKEIIACDDVNHYKNLKKPLQFLKRVHIDKSFVLIFSVDENTKHIIFEEFDHHDNIYKL